MLIAGQAEEEELANIKNWLAADLKNTPAKLNEVDRYFLVLSKVPNVVARLRSWQFTLTFNEINNANLTDLLLVQKGINLIANSKNFRKVIEIVLAVGNFMNFGTRTGNTVAFDISCLPKLAETRANKKEAGSLLNFIISTIEKNYPETMAWTTELADLKYAKAASWDKIDMGMRETKAQLTLARNLAGGVKLTGPTDKFTQIQQKIAKADEDFNDVKNIHDEVVKEWEALAKAYGKETKTMKPEQFFQLIHEFVELFDNSIRDTKRAKMELEAAQEREQKEQAELQKRKTEAAQALAKSPAKLPRGVPTETDNSVSLDDLLGTGATAKKSTAGMEALKAKRVASARRLERK